MKSFSKLFALLIFFSILQSCSEESAPVPVDNPDKEPVVMEHVTLKIDENSFAQIPTEPGLHDVTLQISDGKEWNLRLHVPDTSIAAIKLRPLVIGLDGGDFRDTYKDFDDCLVGPGFQNMKAYVMVPEAGPWIHDIVMDKIFHFIELAIENLSVDPNKIIVMGYSKGGTATWKYAIEYPDIFRVAIPMASDHFYDDNPTIPIYGIIGEFDNIFSPDKMKSQVFAGGNKDSKFILAGGLNHFEFCQYAPFLSDAVKYLNESVFKE